MEGRLSILICVGLVRSLDYKGDLKMRVLLGKLVRLLRDHGHDVTLV